jgi:hypothetical protein
MGGPPPTTNSQEGLSFYNDLAGNVKQDHIYVDGVDISGFGGIGLTIGGYNGSSGYNDVRFTNVVSHDNREAGITTYGYTFNTASPNYANTNVYVGHCLAYNNDGDPASIGNTGNGIVLGSVNGGIIERCIAHDNGINNTPSEGPAGIWAYDSNAVTIQYNESFHNRSGSKAGGDGFALDQSVSNSVMQYNYSHENDGAGFLVFAGAGLTNSGNVVRYNISQNDARKNYYGGIDIAGAVNGLDVYNNTVYLSLGPSPTNLVIRNISALPQNLRIRNNIFSGGYMPVNSVADSTYVFQGNDYHGDSGCNLRALAISFQPLIP